MLTARIEPGQPGGTSVHRALVVVAAAAGGVQALGHLLGELPAFFPAPILVAQQLVAGLPSSLVPTLQRATALSVRQAKSGESTVAARVYLPPPGELLRLHADGTTLQTSSAAPGPRWSAAVQPADALFGSVAGSGAVRSLVAGVVLTGTGRDGAEGIRALKAAGAITIAQDARSARFFDMPRAAIATGCVDEVLPLHAIAQALVRLILR